jgi:hypothetical protein
VSGEPARPEDVLAEILRAAGMSPAEVPDSRAEREAAYRTYLAGRRLLLVLDDAARPDQVRPLLPGTAGCAVIVASQCRLVGLTASRSVNLAPFADDEAMALLAHIVDRSSARRRARRGRTGGGGVRWAAAGGPDRRGAAGGPAELADRLRGPRAGR